MLRKASLLPLNAVAIALYFFIIYHLGWTTYVKNSLYLTSDAKEYLSVSKWIIGTTHYLDPQRTIFYPFVIFLATKTFGTLGVWFVQFVFWILTCNFSWLSVINITKNKVAARVALVITVLNLSTIIYTVHALTETTTLFLLSLFIYSLSIRKQREITPLLIFFTFFIVSLLAITKPLYLPVWYISLSIIIMFCFKLIARKPIIILLIACASVPVIIQGTINEINFHSWYNNKNTEYTFREYLFLKTQYYITHNELNSFENISDTERMAIAERNKTMSTSEMKKYLLQNPFQTAYVYGTNLLDNLYKRNSYLEFNKNSLLVRYNTLYNRIFFYFHLAFLILWLVYLFKNFSKNSTATYTFVLIGGALSYYILLTSGVSFWTGDRLVTPATALWAVIYPVLIFQFLAKTTLLKNKPETQRTHS